MPLHIHITVHVLSILFLIGAIGCAIAIPIIAWKFASVLFEKDSGEDETQDQPRKHTRSVTRIEEDGTEEDEQAGDAPDSPPSATTRK